MALASRRYLEMAGAMRVVGHSHRVVFLLLMGAAGGLLWPTVAAAGQRQAAAGDGPRLLLGRSQQPGHQSRIEVVGLSEAQLAALREADLDPSQWQRLLAIYVETGQNAADRLALFGQYHVEPSAIVFDPRYPWAPGLKYRIVFHPARLPGPIAASTRPVERVIAIPERAPAPPTTLRRVYPSSDVLPENALKFYLHFSGPMSRGQAYRHIHLLTATGDEVELPFLELDEELWDPSRTRFTLFFDPGRIKRGLKPREEVGPSLVEGKAYTLLIDRQWLDAVGRPLEQSFRKTFKVTAPDYQQPDPKQWHLKSPRVATTSPLTVVFNEPLDHAMLGRVLAVTDADQKPLAGSIAVDRSESRWRFRPDMAWRPGRYTVVVETTLEDMAGNSIARPFEIDVFRTVEARITTTTLEVPFTVDP